MSDSAIMSGQESTLPEDNSEPVTYRLFKLMSRWRLSFAAHVIDFCALLAASVITYGLLNHSGLEEPTRYFAATLLVSVVSWFNFDQCHLYDIRSLLDEVGALRTIIARWTIVLMGFGALSALTQLDAEFSRLWFPSFYALGLVNLLISRMAMALVLRRAIAKGYVTQSVVVFGESWLNETVSTRLAGNPLGIRVVGLFNQPAPRNGEGGLGKSFDSLIDFIRHHHVDTVVLALPLAETRLIDDSILALRQHPINIRLLPGELGIDRLNKLKLVSSELPGLHLIPVADRPMSDFAIFLKGVFDRIAAAAALLLALPVLLICAVGIKLSSPGPILFCQKRVGYKGHHFEIYKFRTMHVSAKPNTMLTQRNDPRLFKFGSLIRKVSFDELPQLFNVLKGDMSLVGPRPHMPEARAAGKLYFEAVTEYAGRHRVKPGLTGWAQVNGWRGPTDTITQIQRRVEHDMYYIENWSLALDFLILAKTVAIGFFGKNAF